MFVIINENDRVLKSYIKEKIHLICYDEKVNYKIIKKLNAIKFKEFMNVQDLNEELLNVKYSYMIEVNDIVYKIKEINYLYSNKVSIIL